MKSLRITAIIAFLTLSIVLMGLTSVEALGTRSSTVSVNFSTNPIALGYTTTVTAIVDGGNTNPKVVPTGTVVFTLVSGTGTFGTVSDLFRANSYSSSASVTFTPSSIGTCKIKATYSGDSTYSGPVSSSEQSLTVNKATPSIGAVTLNPTSTITFGGSVTPSVTVSGVSGIPVTGTVTFYVSTDSGLTFPTTLGTGTLSGGSATCGSSYTPTAAGSNYRFRAGYTTGDSNYNTIPASGTGTSLTVNKASPTLTVSANPEKILTTGGTIIITATLTTSSGQPISGKNVKVEFTPNVGGTMTATQTTDVYGKVTPSFNVPAGQTNGAFYVITATFVTDSQYLDATAVTTDGTGGGGLMVVPEYIAGALTALGACFVGFVVFKKRSSLPQLR
jgi:hypothetical protein